VPLPDQPSVSGYVIDRAAFELPELGLTEDETRALKLAMAAVHLDLGAGDEALWKVTGPDLDADAAAGGEGASPPRVELPEAAGLDVLFEAQAARATVSFRYHGRPRELDPYGLLLRGGFWYVIGFDHASAQQRTYRVDRVEGEITRGAAQAFERPEGFDTGAALALDPQVLGEGEPEVARVWVAPLRALRVEREVGSEAVEERRADGSIVVRVPFTNGPALRSWVLGLMDQAELLGPPAARAELVAWLEALAAPVAS